MDQRGNDRRSDKHGVRPRIAFLAGYVNDEYEWAIWQGARRVIEARSGSVVWLAGAGLDEARPENRARSPLFELVHPTAVHGILCLSSVIGQYAGVARTEAWLAERGLPVCSIGPGERLPSVAVDDASGISQLTQHLVAHHGHRRIAFIGGTPSNPEAQARFQAYVHALAKHGLAADPRLVLQGNFTPESGARAVAELFDQRQLRLQDLDAVMAANDYMAFGAIDELTRRRISVPDQVAVVGFDDIPPARLASPSLTTVRQPLEQLGRVGAERLLASIDGSGTAGAQTLETELVLRRSCGCIPTDIPVPTEEYEEVTIPGKAQLGAKLHAALTAELAGNTGVFLRALEPYLRQVAAGNAERLDHGRRFADELSARMRVAHQDLIHERLSDLSRALHARMFGPLSPLSTTLAELLPDFGVDECVVSAFVQKEAGAKPEELKLAFGFDAQTLQPQMTTFDARELVPASFAHLRARSVLVLPLTMGTELLGIAVLPPSPQDGAFYETVADLFATVLKVLELRRRAGR